MFKLKIKVGYLQFLVLRPQLTNDKNHFSLHHRFTPVLPPVRVRLIR
jgi:hypothetical protein